MTLSVSKGQDQVLSAQFTVTSDLTARSRARSCESMQRANVVSYGHRLLKRAGPKAAGRRRHTQDSHAGLFAGVAFVAGGLFAAVPLSARESEPSRGRSQMRAIRTSSWSNWKAIAR